MNQISLTELCSLTMGQSPSSDSYNDEQVGYPFYQGNADFGKLHPCARMWCDKPKKMAKKDDILISVRAPIGALNIATEDCCIGRGLAAITVNSSKSDMLYLFYALSAYNTILQNKGTGSTFKAINKNALKELLIPDYSKEKQVEIGQVLQKVDQLIDTRNKQLSKLDELVKSRFKEMFGDPLLNNKKLPTNKGEYFFKLSNGKAVPEQERLESGIAAYGGNGISFYTNRSIVSNDTIVIGRVGFQSGNVHYVKGPLWVTDNAMYISNYNEKQYNLIYLCELMKCVNFSRFQDAGDLKKITQKPFMAFEYISPSMEKQIEFVTFKEKNDNLKTAIQKSLNELETLKKSLMQQYFG